VRLTPQRIPVLPTLVQRHACWRQGNRVNGARGIPVRQRAEGHPDNHRGQIEHAGQDGGVRVRMQAAAGQMAVPGNL